MVTKVRCAGAGEDVVSEPVVGVYWSEAPERPRPAIRFDRESIRVLVPQKAWVVYRLIGPEGQIVYAGASGSPRTRLLAHLRDGKPALLVELEFFRSSTAMAVAERTLLDSVETEIPAGFGRRHAAWRARDRRK